MLGVMQIPAVADLYWPVVDAIGHALETILTPEGILILLLGTLIGLFFGILPGFGGILSLALVFPFVYQLEAELGFLMLAATLGGGAFGASLPAISLNVPGLPSNIATCWDGNQMTQKGEMSRAIGASATSSALGATVGIVLLILSLPILRELILLFAAPEVFAVAVVGLVIIALVTRDAPVRGMIALFLGLSISFIGMQEMTRTARFTLAGDVSNFLYAGISLVPVAVGLYAISEAIRLILHVDHIGDGNGGDGDGGGGRGDSSGTTVLTGVKDTFANKGLFLRSSAIGWVVGLIPGVGGVFANVMAYTQGKNFSKNPDAWGTGIPQGVIAPEASNDAKDGGATIPTITFGVPGSGAQVFFLAGMTANGLFPGTDMLTTNLHITMSIILGLLFANLITSTIGLLAGGHMSRIITTFRPKSIAAVITMIALLGAYSINGNMFEVYATVFFGLVGYVMWRYDYPRILFIIAFVLGPIIDTMFGQSYQLFGPAFVLRPMTLLIVVLATAAILFSYRNEIRGVTSA